jgi:hypothetical protein
MHFDEIFASTVSDRPSEQKFKNLKFCKLQSPFLVKLKSNLINFLRCYTWTMYKSTKASLLSWNVARCMGHEPSAQNVFHY